MYRMLLNKAMIDHFAKLIETLTAEPLYVPNETDLIVTGLTTLLSNMKAAPFVILECTIIKKK